ncbi:MAG: hypothetical protein ABMA00_04025 [Gemmatimonas sp.]
MSFADEEIRSVLARGPSAFLPGERVVVDWPWWGTWTCFVMSRDVEGRRVTLNDGWGDAAGGAAIGSLLTLWLA